MTLNKQSFQGQSQLDVLDARIDELKRQGATGLGCGPNDAELQAKSSSLCDLDLTDASSELMSSTPGLTSLESSFYSGHCEGHYEGHYQLSYGAEGTTAMSRMTCDLSHTHMHIPRFGEH